MQATDDNLTQFRATLLEWWKQGGARSFSWRKPENRTPYRAVLAEIMLRRTRADQVEAVYDSFLERFPTLSDALSANPEEVKNILYPLGLAWRAGNVLSLFEAVKQQELRDFPADVISLQSLPGIGDYVSNAVACFTGADRGATLIDTNVVRVLGRVFGLDTSGEARRRKSVRTLAERAVDREYVAEYHYAILDFAARICVAGAPRCKSCPLSRAGQCDYFNSKGESSGAG